MGSIPLNTPHGLMRETVKTVISFFLQLLYPRDRIPGLIFPDQYDLNTENRADH